MYIITLRDISEYVDSPHVYNVLFYNQGGVFLKSLRPPIFIGLVVVLNQTFYISHILNVYQILLMSFFFFIIIFSYHAHGKEVILLEVLYYYKASIFFFFIELSVSLMKAQMILTFSPASTSGGGRVQIIFSAWEHL